MTGVSLNNLVVLDQRTRLIPVQPRHHNVNKNQIGLMVGYLRQRVESIDCCEYVTTFFGQQRFCGTTYRLAVIHNEDLEPIQTSRCII